jgi:hypothetical protein
VRAVLTQDPLTLYIQAKNRLLTKVKDLEWCIRYDRIEDAMQMAKMVQEGLEELAQLLQRVEEVM